MGSEEDSLMQDPRLAVGLNCFNASDWYAAHDLFEELWHETQGPVRPVLQGVLQIAVAHLHLERDNSNGAMILLGEGIGRLSLVDDNVLGLDIQTLKTLAQVRLQRLQRGLSLDGCPPLRLDRLSDAPSLH
jgi:predicted metal-dependent hydrolase